MKRCPVYVSNALQRERERKEIYKIQISPWNFKHIECDGQVTQRRESCIVHEYHDP